MNTLCRVMTFATAALALAASAAHADEPTAQAAAVQATLVSLETSAYAAVKARDQIFWRTFLSDTFVGWGSSGRLDKALATEEFTGANCKIERFAISNVQMSLYGRDVALITHKNEVDGTCDGHTLWPAAWAASVFVREGGRWKAAFHAQAAIVDPTAPQAKPAATKAVGASEQFPAGGRDARTDALLRREQVIWDAWKNRDAKKLDGLIAPHIQFINIFGVHLATKADALKNWSGEGCDVTTVRLTDAAATMLAPTIGLLTFRASADGTCFGQKVGPVWGSSIYVRQGSKWLWSFGINRPAPPDKG